MKFLIEQSELFSNNKDQAEQVIEDIKWFKENSIYPAVEKGESGVRNKLISFIAKNMFKILPEDLTLVDHISLLDLISDLLKQTLHSFGYPYSYELNITIQDIYDKVLYYISKINPIAKNRINDILYGTYLANNWDDWYNKTTKTLTIPDNIKYIEKFLERDLSEASPDIYLKLRDEVENLILPDTIRILSTQGFYCKNLKYVRLPSNLEIIEGAAIRADYIPEVIVPDNVSEIKPTGIYADIGKITLPATLKTLGYNPFFVSKESEILFKGTRKQWYSLTENLKGTGKKTLFRKIVKYI